MTLAQFGAQRKIRQQRVRPDGKLHRSDLLTLPTNDLAYGEPLRLSGRLKINEKIEYSVFDPQSGKTL